MPFVFTAIFSGQSRTLFERVRSQRSTLVKVPWFSKLLPKYRKKFNLVLKLHL